MVSPLENCFFLCFGNFISIHLPIWEKSFDVMNDDNGASFISKKCAKPVHVKHAFRPIRHLAFSNRTRSKREDLCVPWVFGECPRFRNIVKQQIHGQKQWEVKQYYSCLAAKWFSIHTIEFVNSFMYTVTRTQRSFHREHTKTEIILYEQSRVEQKA